MSKKDITAMAAAKVAPVSRVGRKGSKWIDSSEIDNHHSMIEIGKKDSDHINNISYPADHSDIRQSGIDVVGDIRWGTHICQFYETEEDLIETLVPYFKQGLEANEFCIWITSSPLITEGAAEALRAEVPDLEERMGKGQIEILDSGEWYTKGGSFESDRMLQWWIDKLESALKRGYGGLRLSANSLCVERSQCDDLLAFEEKFKDIISSRPMIAICNYNIKKCSAACIMEVIVDHDLAMIRRDGRLDIIERTPHQQTKLTSIYGESYYQTLYSSMNEMFVFHEIVEDQKGNAVDYRILDCNTMFSRITGISKESAIGKLASAVYKTDRPPYLDLFERVSRTQVSIHFETYFSPIKKHFSISVFSPKKGLFATLISDITDRKVIEKALIASEKKYRRLFESSKDGILILDAKTGDVVDVNPFLINLFGYTKERIIGKKAWNLELFKDIVANKSNFKKLQAKGYIRYEDMPLRTIDGRQINVEFISNVYQVDHKTVIQCNIRDISENKKMVDIIRLRLQLLEQAAKSSLEEFLQKGLDDISQFTTSSFGLLHLVHDDQKTTSLLSSSTRVVCGSFNVLGKKMYNSIDKSEILIDCIRERRSIAFNDLTSLPHNKRILLDHSKIVRGILIPIIRSDRIVAVFSLWNKPRFYTEHDLEIIPYLADLIWEIADRKRVQEDCISIARFPEEDPNPILRVTTDARIIYANNASTFLLSAWNCRIGDALPRPYMDIVFNSLRAGESRKIEISENSRIFDAVFIPFSDSGYLNIYAIDITDRRRAEAALEKAHEWLLAHERLATIGAVAGSMAHDLRNPLASIKNAIYYLKMSIKDQDSGVHDTFSMLEKDISASEKVINDLLDFARPKNPVRKQVIADHVTNVALARIGVPENIEIVKSFGENMRFIADPELLAIALSSLIENAIQAMPDGGKIMIDFNYNEDPGTLTISVSDTGPGIPPENIEKVFDPLFTTKSHGTGLGLPLARTLVEMHEGRIYVFSEAGNGTTFAITIPTGKKRHIT